MSKLTEVRLSNNPNATVVPSKDGINGKINESSDGAQYCTLVITDDSNPFKKSTCVRNYRQQMSGGKWKWPGLTPKEFSALQGKEIGGRFYTAIVEPYQIDGRIVHQYTTFVAENESVATVFRNAGHALVVNTETGEVAMESATKQVEA